MNEFTIEKWGGRYWALFDGEELICLTVYNIHCSKR